MPEIEFHPEAATEIELAEAWYAARSPVAADAFLLELAYSVESIREAPERYPRYWGETRRRQLPRFPFSIIYRLADQEIVVIALAHHRRRPGYWNERDS